MRQKAWEPMSETMIAIVSSAGWRCTTLGTRGSQVQILPLRPTFSKPDHYGA